MTALDESSVDLSLMSPEEREADWVPDISEDYGQNAIDLIVDRVLERVDDMVANPRKYLAHYTPM